MRTLRLNIPVASVFLALAAQSSLSAQISVIITVGPPPIPIYEQPICPDDGYAWAPGYWAWGDDGYFWVPGTWVRVPMVGMLWTPGYWGWSGDAFFFHSGYWGTEVGFYGGINYGYGYGGYGFEGGYWQGQNYYYNRSVTNVNTTRITNVYTKTVIINNNTTIAYNGGAGGLRAAPTPRERTVEREHHVAPTQEQIQHHQSASQNRELLASVNRGKPPVAATARPADFSPKNVVPAKAPGGRVEEATLKATSKMLLPPSKGSAANANPVSRTPIPEQPPARSDRPSNAAPPHPPSRLQEAPAAGPAPERRPEPAPHPAPQPNREPAPRPAPRPQEPPAGRPAPERNPAPAPHPQAEPERKPAPRPAPKPEPNPNKPPQKEEHPGS